MFSLITNFFYSWYIDDTRNFWNWFINFIKMLDRSIGLIGNLQNWTSPLYGDYSYVGVVIGPVFRTLRIFFGLLIYLIIAILSSAVYIFWIILPIALIIMIVLNFIALFKPSGPIIALGKRSLEIFIQ